MIDRDDERLMRLALAQAEAAASAGDVPVGAVLVSSTTGVPIASGRNRRELDADPTAHAEMVALRSAAAKLGRWRLDDLTMVVTLEPCPMCAGALVNARIGGLVFGCRDDKAGAVASLFVIGRDPRLNHRFPVRGGVLESECAERLRSFFAARRG